MKVDPKTVFKPFLNPKNSSLEPKIKSKSNVRIEETKKMKVVELHE